MQCIEVEVVSPEANVYVMDLIIYDPDTGNEVTTLKVGKQYTLSAVLKNDGNARGTCDVMFYWKKKYGTDSKEIATLTGEAVPCIEPNQVATVSIPYTVEEDDVNWSYICASELNVRTC